MYDADWLPRLTALARTAGPPARWRVSPNVWGLGVTSLLTDASAEMVISILPAYLVLTGGFAPLALGVATGLHAGGPILAAWIGGVVADRSGRRKLTAAAGYALSAICRCGWWALMPGRMVSLIALFTVTDRIGKAIRTAPRDAIISLSAEPDQQATAFGVHRALDAAGAAAGPFIAWLLLWQLPRRYDVVFFASLVLAVMGLVALILLVRDEGATGHEANGAARAALPGIADLLAMGREPMLRRIAVLAAAFSLAAVGDPFLYVMVVERSPIGAEWIPLLYTGTALSFLILAVPLGSLADRFGRQRVFIFGHVSLLLAYIVAGGRVVGWPWSPIACVLLLGTYYAASDGVLAGLAGAFLPPETRATGLAWVATAVAGGRLCSALLFGLLWARYGANAAIGLFGVALAVLIAAFGRGRSAVSGAE